MFLPAKGALCVFTGPRCGSYCRVSTDSEEQLTSYTTQKKVYTEMIAARTDWEFAGLYADEGISGTRADKRPEFKKMINDCLAGKIDYIITKSVSRFARNTVDCLDHVRILKSKGIGIFFEEQNIDTLKIDSELYLVIYAGFAQSESESMSKNITWSFRKRFEDGNPVFMYKKLLGYRKSKDGMPEVIPEEAFIVERIFNMYLAGETANRIFAILRSEKIQIPDKKLSFGSTMIANILTNEKYCGDSILQKRSRLTASQKHGAKTLVKLLCTMFRTVTPQLSAESCSTKFKRSLFAGRIESPCPPRTQSPHQESVQDMP